MGHQSHQLKEDPFFGQKHTKTFVRHEHLLVIIVKTRKLIFNYLNSHLGRDHQGVLLRLHVLHNEGKRFTKKIEMSFISVMSICFKRYKSFVGSIETNRSL